MSTKATREYLGDGLYAEHDGFMYELIAPREGGDHFVCLEPEVLNAFMRYIEKRDGVKITVTQVRP